MAPGTPGADGSQGVVLGGFGVGDVVETTRHALDKSIVHQAAQFARVDA